MDKIINTEYKDVELNYENCVCYVVDEDIFNSVLQKKPKSINIDLDDGTAYNLIELDEDECIIYGENVPKPKYGGCYYWNKGRFPYVLNYNLKFIILSDGRKTIKYIIKSRKVYGTPDFQANRKINEPSGDWFVKFIVEVFAYGDYPQNQVDNIYMENITYK